MFSFLLLMVLEQKVRQMSTCCVTTLFFNFYIYIYIYIYCVCFTFAKFPSCDPLVRICLSRRGGFSDIWVVKSWTDHIYVLMMSQEASPSPPPSLPLVRGSKVMKPCSSLFHQFSSASLPLPECAHWHPHTVRLTHTLFPPGLAGRTALLIQRGEGQLDRVHL